MILLEVTQRRPTLNTEAIRALRLTMRANLQDTPYEGAHGRRYRRTPSLRKKRNDRNNNTDMNVTIARKPAR